MEIYISPFEWMRAVQKSDVALNPDECDLGLITWLLSTSVSSSANWKQHYIFQNVLRYK
jgi:hypothetical protein